MRQNSQIATILTLVIAAVFLFIVITMNIGRVSKKKTVIDNACDSAGILLASGLGSVANSLRYEAGLTGALERKCDFNPVLAGSLAVFLIGAVLAPFTSGGTLVAALAAVGGGIIGITSQTIFASYNDPGLVREMQAKYQNMTAEQRIFEGAIKNALDVAVDDPQFVPDRFDADRDNRRFSFPAELDKIPRFSHWYFQRLNSLPRYGHLVEQFYRYLFTSPRVFAVDESSETYKALRAPLRVNGADGPWLVTDWLKNEFRDFLREMRSYGYGVSFHNPSSDLCYEYLSDLDRFILDITGGVASLCSAMGESGVSSIPIKGLEDEMKSIYGLGKEEVIGTFEVFFARFYNGNPADSGKWYFKVGQWRALINSWINELTVRRGEVLDCVRGCDAWVGCCEENPTYPCPDDPTQNCGGGCKKDCCQEHKPCGEACGNPTCGPSSQCDTPTGGRRSCCDSGVKLKDGCDNTRIDPYITKLRELDTTLLSLQEEFVYIYNEAQSLKNNPWNHKAIYVWGDITGRETGGYAQPTIGPTSSVHMVYVRLDMEPNATPDYPDFKFPFLDQEVELTSLSVCKSVNGASGFFTITVGRYDEDLAKRGPLSDFWKFKFRRHPEADERDLGLLDTVAGRFSERLDQGEAVALDELATSDQFEELASFCFDNGIVSRIRVHYGPGVTPTREQLTNRSQPAAEKNRDIYIQSRER